jgi:hypothetical protein
MHTKGGGGDDNGEMERTYDFVSSDFNFGAPLMHGNTSFITCLHIYSE